MVRTPCCDKNGLKKGTWTPEEDRKLKAYITRYGSWNWRQLPKFAGLSRCGKSCRLRWMNYLRPNIKRGNFSKEEEDIIIKSHESLGTRWSAIAAQLPGRTDNEIKNHWHSYLKKRSRQISISKGEEPSSDDRSKRKKAADKRTSESQKFSTSDFSTHQILESSHVSSPPPELCSLMVNDAAVNSNITAGFLAENDVSLSPSDVFDETTGSFWTEPFVAGDYDDSAYHVPALFEDTGGFSPDYPVAGDEFLWPSFEEVLRSW